MLRTVVIYGLILATLALVLQWLEYKMMAQTHPLEIYFGLFALGFMALGVWAGAKLFRNPIAATPFTVNTTVMETLGISRRELEVLELLASGKSNKEISAKLNVSPNTVETHVAKLYEKLEVKRRTEAILKARELGMLR